MMSSSLPSGPVGIIGGSSYLQSSYFIDFELLTIETPFGGVLIRSNRSRTLFFIQRHGADPLHEYSPPHLINKRAIIFALASLGCRRIIAFGSVGSLKKTLPVGTIVIPDDYFNAFHPISFFDYSKSGHLVPSFDASLRSFVIDGVASMGVASFIKSGVYAQTVGPRFETAAEIRFLSQSADIVGMTCAHEAELCKELGLSYAVICMIDNMANGLADSSLTEKEFHDGVKRNLITMEKVLGGIIMAVSPTLPASPPSPLSVAEVYANATNPPTTTSTNASSSSSSSSPCHPLVDASGRRFVDLIVNARWIVPIEPENVVYENCSLIVNEGKIIDILPRVAVQSKYVSLNVQNMDSHCVMPGLINCHTHLGMTLLRGYSDDHCLSDWLSKHIWPAERKFVDPEFVRDSTELGIAELIRGGSTLFNEMYFYPEVVAQQIEKSGIRGVIGLILLDFPSVWASDVNEYFEKGAALRKQYSNHSRIKFTVAPHAPYTVCDASLERVRDVAKDYGASIHTHLHETHAEVHDSKAGAGNTRHRSDQLCSPVHNFDRLKLLNNNLIAVHMTQLTDEEIKLCADRQVNVIHCPSSNLKLASGFCPIAKLVAAGVNVALGTDSSASNNSLDMFLEMRTAAILAKAVANDATAVYAHQALRMATISGARALGVDKEVGSLVIGKQADFIAVHFGELESSPLQDVASQLVYASSRYQVSDVWVAGKQLLRNRELVTLSMDGIMQKARSWEKKLGEFKAEQAKSQAALNPSTTTEKSETILLSAPR